jgi:hypothetical protein
MRIMISFALVVLSISVKAQFTWEHTYDSASTINSSRLNQLMIVRFEVSGERYVKINQENKSISVYDLNHSLLKTMSFWGFPNSSTSEPNLIYISENLFNTDPKMEYLYSSSAGSGSFYTGIYNEDGLLLFSDTGLVAIRPSIEQQQYPIYNTSLGTKMIISYSNGQAKVFGLGGTLTTTIDNTNQNLLKSRISNPYPNPASNSTTIDYQLPAGSQQGEIVFYDFRGKEIKRFKVDNAFNSLILSTSDLPAGTYYYQLQTANNTSAGKKLVVIK